LCDYLILRQALRVGECRVFPIDETEEEITATDTNYVFVKLLI